MEIALQCAVASIDDESNRDSAAAACHRATFTALAAFIEVIQKIADVATGAKG